jgi:hypothetical protein
LSVVKIIELIGISDSSWEDAAAQAVQEANKTIRGISGIDVVGQTAEVSDGKITKYKANVKIAFLVER